ncbi:MAG: ATP-binding cassette domain-containing protein [Pseudonocardiaceae bacterium]|nr:MAG: ATP-binding cassette domain-containing protein [Pseudonocardiaceae bacterium]
MSTTADEGRTPPPRRPSVTPDHEHDRHSPHDRHSDHDRYDPDDRYSAGNDDEYDDRDRYDDDDDEPYERSSIADVREAAKVPIRHIFKRFWPDTKPFRGRMLLSLLLVAVGPALGTLNIYLFKVLVDDIITPQDFSLFPLVAGAFLAITVVGGLINFGDEYMTAWVGEKFVMGLRQRVFDHMHRLSSGYFETRQLGDLLSRLTGDVSSIEQLMLSGVNMALTYSFQIVFYAGAMFILNWQLTLAALVAAPIFLLIARSFSRRIQSAARESRRRAGSISAVAEESFGNVALVQAYDRADHESRRFRDQNLGNFRAQMRAIKIEGLFSPISAFVESVGTLVVIGIGVWELSQNRITLGGLLVFLAYISQLYGPVQGFAGLTNSIFAASASAERIIEVLDAEPGVEEPAKPVRMRRARGDIRITGVEFGYPGTDRTALHDVDLEIAAGTKVAVVGASGAGKSTLTKLLLRTYDPDSGTITLDDVDLRDLTLSDLRRNITAVLQETLVFDGSIADNIRWGRPDATDEDVATAAAAADAHDFVLRLPDGYDTRIGQRGRMLSGGQRQRIAIARAMIRDAPVLLLDEPTTGLDAESTRRVLEPLRRLMDGRTTVIISHNLITVTDADEIVFVEDGTVSARGSHEKLLATSPGYAHLYRLHHPDDAAVSAPDLENAAAAARPVPRPRVAPAPAALQSDREREGSTRPVPVPFRRPEHTGPAAPRRYVAMPVAGAPAAPPAPRRVDEPRGQTPARPEVYADARSGRGIEETSLLGTPGRRPVPGPGGASEWAPGNASPQQRNGSGRQGAGSDEVAATRAVRPVRPADSGPRRPDGPRDDRPRDDRPRDDRGRGPRDERDGARGRDVNGFRWEGVPANGSRPDGSRANGSRADGSRADGSRADGSRADGSRVNGMGVNGARPEGQRADASRADGVRVDGSHVNGMGVNGSRPEGRPADGSRRDGSRPDGSGFDGSRRDNSRADGARRDDDWGDSAPHDDSRRDRARRETARPDEMRTNGSRRDAAFRDSTRPDGSRADDSRRDDSLRNGSRPDGSRADGSRPDGSRADGSRAGGSRAGGSRADGSRPDGSRADRSRANGRSADVARDDRSRADAAEARGSRRDGAHDHRSPADSRHLNGPRADDSQPDGRRTNGIRPNGSPVSGARPADSAPDDRYTESPQVNGSRVNGSHVDRSEDDGRVNSSRRDDTKRDGYAQDDARPARARRRDDSADERRPRPRRRRPTDDRDHYDTRRDDRDHVSDRYDDRDRRDDRDGPGRRRRDTGAHRPDRHSTDRHSTDRHSTDRHSDDRHSDDRRRAREDAPVGRRDAEEPRFGAGAGEVSETTALPGRRPRRDDTDDRYREDRGRARHSRATRQDRARDENRGPDEFRERDEVREDRNDRGSRHTDDRRRPGRSTSDHEPRARRDDGTRRDDRTRDGRRDPDRDRRPSNDVDSPTAALPLVHLTQAFAKLTVPDPRVPDDDVDSETTAFRPIPRPRRRSWLTGELPKVPPQPPRRR